LAEEEDLAKTLSCLGVAVVCRSVLDKNVKGRNYIMCKPQIVMEVLQMGANSETTTLP